jgi:hypothetical protein
MKVQKSVTEGEMGKIHGVVRFIKPCEMHGKQHTVWVPGYSNIFAGRFTTSVQVHVNSGVMDVFRKGWSREISGIYTCTVL